MVKCRKQYSAAFKAKVALRAAIGDKSVAQISSEFHVHPSQVRVWRKQLVSALPEIFMNGRKRPRKSHEHPIDM